MPAAPITLPPPTNTTAICRKGSFSGKSSSGGTAQARPAASAPAAKRHSQASGVPAPSPRRYAAWTTRRAMVMAPSSASQAASCAAGIAPQSTATSSTPAANEVA